MAGERVIPILPCRRLDDVLPFYAALGFEQTYRQERPNPYLGVRRGTIELHFFGLEAFDPEQSMGSVIVLTGDTAALFDAFAAGLRAAYGRLPVAGIPRITRPRRAQGTAGGFSVVDPGGNWLRVSAATQEGGGSAGRLDRVLRSAVRQGDVHGDEARAVAVLDTGLARHADAPVTDRVPALVYLAELLVRRGDRGRARAVLAEVRAGDLDDEARAALRRDLATAAELDADLAGG